MISSPTHIDALASNEVFVFGSNTHGMHLGGAARVALAWGAKMGQSIGMAGQTYALPTLDWDSGQRVPLFDLTAHIDDFITFAKVNPQLTFLVTPIGCGIAGFKAEEVAPLFRVAFIQNARNIRLPKEFLAVLGG